MTCTALQNDLADLRVQRRQQVQAMQYLQGAGLQAAQEQLARIDADIAATEQALDLCLAQEAQAENPVPQSIQGAVEKIQCHTASKELGKEEPYLLVASFDMTNIVSAGIVGIGLPAVDVVKVGPWTGVSANETHRAATLPAINRPSFWDLNGGAQPIAHQQDVIFLVAFMENDGSSPDAIRGAVRTNLLASRITNTNRPYAAYVDTMISNMTGAIETASIAGLDPLHLNEDDLIGGVQHLDLSPNDLAQLNRIEPVTKSLRFTQQKANHKVVNDYTATFLFSV